MFSLLLKDIISDFYFYLNLGRYSESVKVNFISVFFANGIGTSYGTSEDGLSAGGISIISYDLCR